MSTFRSISALNFALLLSIFLLLGVRADSESRFTKYVISSSSGNYSTTSASMVDVTNLSITYKNTGRPMIVALVADNNALGDLGGGAMSQIRAVGDASSARAGCSVELLDGADPIAYYNVDMTTGTAESMSITHAGGFTHIFVPTAGSHTYKIQAARTVASSTCQIHYLKLIGMEMP